MCEDIARVGATIKQLNMYNLAQIFNCIETDTKLNNIARQKLRKGMERHCKSLYRVKVATGRSDCLSSIIVKSAFGKAYKLPVIFFENMLQVALLKKKTLKRCINTFLRVSFPTNIQHAGSFRFLMNRSRKLS